MFLKSEIEQKGKLKNKIRKAEVSNSCFLQTWVNSHKWHFVLKNRVTTVLPVDETAASTRADTVRTLRGSMAALAFPSVEQKKKNEGKFALTEADNKIRTPATTLRSKTHKFPSRLTEWEGCWCTRHCSGRALLARAPHRRWC